MTEDFRPQNKPRPLYKLNPDSVAGLKSTVRNNQPLMALEYVAKLFEDVHARLDKIEAALEVKPKAAVRKPE